MTRTNEVMRALDRILARLVRLEKVIRNHGNPATPVADLEAEAETLGTASWPDNSTPSEMEERREAVEASKKYLQAVGYEDPGRKTKELYVDVQVLMLGFAESERKRLRHAEAETCGRSASEVKTTDRVVTWDCMTCLLPCRCTVSFHPRATIKPPGECLYRIRDPEWKQAQNERCAERSCCDPAAPDSFTVTIEPCPEPLMPAIDPELESRVEAAGFWLCRFVGRDEGQPYRVSRRGRLAVSYHGFSSADRMLDWLAAECPEPSEPETEEQSLRTLSPCVECVFIGVHTGSQPCEGCTVRPSNYEPK